MWIVVADEVADMVVDEVADMVANMEMDKMAQSGPGLGVRGRGSGV